jgi:toxin ParE1/3/4
MTFSFHPEADEEFVEAVAYYEDCDPGLGIDFTREVYATIQNAVDYPTMWPEVEIEVRRCLVHRFPYHPERQNPGHFCERHESPGKENL